MSSSLQRPPRNRCALFALLTSGMALATGTIVATAADGAVLPSIGARTADQELARPPWVPSDAELERSGATIGEVVINPQDVFDTGDSNDDTTLFRVVNHLHISTRPQTIESQLLFARGQTYSGHALAESERILRSSRYLYDAHIRPIGYHDGVVDVEVRSRDVWTLTPGFSFGRSGGKNTASVELEELNLFGRGTELSVGAISGVDRDSKSIIYRDRQLFDSWWGLSMELSDNSDGYNRALTLEQPFYALDTRRAGGISLLGSDRIDSLYDRGKIVGQFRTEQKLASAYAGWSGGLRDGWSRRWRAGVRYDVHDFSEVADTVTPVAAPPDRKLVYPVLGLEWVQDAYTTTRNRDQIERTEDVCLGWRFAAEVGWSDPVFGADRSALLASGEVSKGLDLTSQQQLLLTGSLAGRLEDAGLADGLASAVARYYFRESERRVLFVSLGADVGSNLDPDHQILLGGDNGLRGYPLRYQAGEGRFLFTAEQRWFTKWYPFRLFNVGAAAFVDAGRTWGDNPAGTPSLGLLKDVGFGLRLGNARSASGNVLHIDLAFPLDGDSSIDSVQLLVETKARF